SGNNLYDAELRRRVEARRYPVAELRLERATHLHDSDRYQIRGVITFHGTTQPLAGTVRVEVAADERPSMQVSGEHVLDMRDFDIAAPSMLMLKIFPDVRVELSVEAATNS
ncbi:MAG TPA: YceI family protein, partial [Acidimicrobiales bacterium]|nr:YceI family protein [Acidimicrobiales bacterium]